MRIKLVTITQPLLLDAGFHGSYSWWRRWNFLVLWRCTEVSVKRIWNIFRRTYNYLQFINKWKVAAAQHQSESLAPCRLIFMISPHLDKVVLLAGCSNGLSRGSCVGTTSLRSWYEFNWRRRLDLSWGLCSGGGVDALVWNIDGW